jgi:hypothetical protein
MRAATRNRHRYRSTPGAAVAMQAAFARRDHLTAGDVLALQRVAGNRAVGRAVVTAPGRPAGRRVLARNPRAGKYVAERALRWLAGRSANISRHVARHTRHIAGRAVHSVFKSPNQVKKLAEFAIKNPDRVTAQVGRRARWVVEKEFNREIGRNGERILRIVVEASGKIITAFPVRAFTAGTAAAVAYLAVDDAVAHAQARLDEVNRIAEKRLEEEEDSFIGGLVKTIVTFGLYSGNLNAGEDVERWVAKEVRKIRADAVTQAVAGASGHPLEEEDDDSLLPDITGALLDSARIAAMVDTSLGLSEMED